MPVIMQTSGADLEGRGVKWGKVKWGVKGIELMLYH